MAPCTDAEAIAASLSEPGAFMAVFDRHFDAIHRYLRRRVGKEIADELASETFAQAFEHRRRYDRGRPDARPWLYGIAHNLLRHHYRDEERALRAYARTGVDPVQGSVGDGCSPGPELADALAALSPGERDVLLLVAWGELEYAEVAEALGIPVGTVRSRLNRARGRVRELLESAPGNTRKRRFDGRAPAHSQLSRRRSRV
jgi:DNA-directed RNA polymerase specialized sigma24 family protein